MIIFAWVGSPLYQGAAEQNWVTGNGGNYGSYTNPEVDKLTNEGARSLDPKKAADLINQADKILAKDAYRPAAGAEAHADVHLLGLRQHPGQRDAVEPDVQHPGLGPESGLTHRINGDPGRRLRVRGPPAPANKRRKLMIAYAVRRLLIGIPVLIAASIFVFVIASLSGNPIDDMEARNPPVPLETRQLEAHRLGLDQPLAQRYVTWLGNLVLHGDFGQSTEKRSTSATRSATGCGSRCGWSSWPCCWPSCSP